MKRILFSLAIALVLIAAGGLLYAKSQASGGGFICPLTGETLPCSKCCPLNR
jgi:hypothetical protein